MIERKGKWKIDFLFSPHVSRKRLFEVTGIFLKGIGARAQITLPIFKEKKVINKKVNLNKIRQKKCRGHLYHDDSVSASPRVLFMKLAVGGLAPKG